jgi:hypothetical protein
VFTLALAAFASCLVVPSTGVTFKAIGASELVRSGRVQVRVREFWLRFRRLGLGFNRLAVGTLAAFAARCESLPAGTGSDFKEAGGVDDLVLVLSPGQRLTELDSEGTNVTGAGRFTEVSNAVNVGVGAVD